MDKIYDEYPRIRIQHSVQVLHSLAVLFLNPLTASAAYIRVFIFY